VYSPICDLAICFKYGHYKLSFYDISRYHLDGLIAVATVLGAIGSILAEIFIRRTWHSEEAVREQENRHFLLKEEMNAIDY
jgi:hypothetical protein